MTRGRRVRLVVLGLLLLASLAFAAFFLWPRGSDNMYVATDGTPVAAIVVCSNTGEVLWRIVASSQTPTLGNEVKYGQVPDGYRQEWPTHGSPRPFRDGEYLQVHVLSATWDMGDAGYASGTREFVTVANFGESRPATAAAVRCTPGE